MKINNGVEIHLDDQIMALFKLKTDLLSELYVLLSRIHIIAICLYYFLFLCLVLIVL